MAEEKSFWQKVKKFAHDIVYVSEDEDETEAPVKEETLKNEPSAPVEEKKEEIREEPVQPEAAPQPQPAEKEKPAETVASLNRDNMFITIDRRASEQPAKQEEKTEMNKVVSTFKRVEIISPVGPSNKFNNNVHFDVKTVKEEKSEFKPIVDIINTMGPQPEDIANDDVDQKVASLSVDDFTGYKPTHAAFNTAEQLAPPVQQPQPVPEPQPVIEPQPVVIPQTVVEVQPEEPVIVQQDDRQSAYIRDFSDVFHTSSQDVIVEQPPVEEKTQAAPDFSIPEHLAEDERKNRMDTDKYENLSLFDFLEDDK